MVDNLTRRVKVYQLNEAGQWDDKGTGHVCYVEEANAMTMIVRCEDTGLNLLEHKVEANIDYQRQGDTIITWCELGPDGGNPIDLALSFQEVLRCNEVWDQIGTAQTKSGEGAQMGDENRPFMDFEVN